MPAAGREPDVALAAFANAELVQPFELTEQNQDLKSDLFVGTAADVAQATTAVVNSPHGGIGGPNKITGTVHGAGRTLHLITSGATGHPNPRVRALIVLVLTAAVTLLVVDVLVPEAPGWVTTAGFSLLLGGIGAIALHFRQPLLGAVLLTLGLPLVVWSLTPDPDAEAASQWLGPIITVAGVVAVMAIIGHVKEPAAPSSPPTGRPAGWLVKASAVLVALVGIGVGLYWLLDKALLDDPNATVFIALAVVAGIAVVAGAGALWFLRVKGPEGTSTVASWGLGLGVLYLVAAAALLLYLGNTATDADQAGATAASSACTEFTSTAPDGTVLTMTSCPSADSPPAQAGTPSEEGDGSTANESGPETNGATSTVHRYLPMTVSLIILGLAGTLIPVLLLLTKRNRKARMSRSSS